MKPGHRVAFVNARAGFADRFSDVEVKAPPASAAGRDRAVRPWERDLLRRLPAATRALPDNGGLWIAWPKRSSGATTDPDENRVRDLILDARPSTRD